MDLAERFSVSTKKDDHPTYLLFVQGKVSPIRYTGDKQSADDVVKFLMTEAGTKLDLKYFMILYSNYRDG